MFGGQAADAAATVIASVARTLRINFMVSPVSGNGRCRVRLLLKLFSQVFGGGD